MIYKVKDSTPSVTSTPSPEYPFSLYDGIINMSVTNTTLSTPETVKADLTASVGNDIKVKITFKGITEVWWKYRWNNWI